jgi:hypothetical protein
VSIKEKLRRILMTGAIGLALPTGAPMRPEEIEELMHRMNQPKLAHTVPDESDQGDGPNTRRSPLRALRNRNSGKGSTVGQER